MLVIYPIFNYNNTLARFYQDSDVKVIMDT